MNIFQRQLMIRGKSIAELEDLNDEFRDYGKIEPQVKISIEEFEAFKKKTQWVYFWWSSSYIHRARFIKWVITKMHTGGDDTHKLGVAALVESDWLFSKAIVNKIPFGCKRGQYILSPYIPLYRSNKSAWKKANPIIRPSVKEVRNYGNNSSVGE